MFYQISVESLAGIEGGRPYSVPVVTVQSVNRSKQHGTIGLLLNGENRT